MSLFQKIIFWLYTALFILVPIILWPYTSEVFEFNKIVLTYALTILIVSAWLGRMVTEGKFIFRRTILDLPFLIFLSTQLISTLLSIDIYTSLYGYYSRFNGGFISLVCYSLLYFAFVSNFNSREALRLLKTMLGTAVVVSVYAVLEHYGIDREIWVQDVQSRVFSTLGQPNWLAAYVVALIPVAWSMSLRTGIKSRNFWLYFLISVLLFWTLIFTKSRSGFLSVCIGSAMFWILVLLDGKKKLSNVLKPLSLTVLTLAVICLISGTQWTPSVSSWLTKTKSVPVVPTVGTALETGGTESGIIRQIVWKGAWQIFMHYPVFGTGVETFAYSYYLYRPVEHNLTSEWDFIYNKAHNEFLNFAATTGFAGITAYILLIAVSTVLMLRSRTEPNYLRYGLASGFVSLSVSNFFGFSVVPTQLQFFLFPALAVAASNMENPASSKLPLQNTAKIALGFLALGAFFLVYLTGKYWYSDILYSRAKAQNSLGRPDIAASHLTSAVKFEPGQAIYFGELATSYSTIAMAYDQNNEATGAAQFANFADTAIEHAATLAPANINIKRQMFGVYVRLSTINEDYLIKARNSLKEAINMAPTDAKLYYNLAVAEANLGQTTEALSDLKKSVELKPNYGDARIEYAALLVHANQKEEAKKQLMYVLTNIDPENSIAKQALANLN